MEVQTMWVISLLFVCCLTEWTFCWNPDSTGICKCTGFSCDGTDSITCVIDGRLPSLHPGKSDRNGTCNWLNVNIIVNSATSLDSTMFNPGFTMCHLIIHQNSTTPIPFSNTDLLLTHASLGGKPYCTVEVHSLSGPLPFVAFDTSQPLHLSFSGSFTIENQLPHWTTISSLQSLTLNSTAYSDLPQSPFANLACKNFTVDIYNVTVMKSGMFLDVSCLSLCNIDRIEANSISISSNLSLLVNYDTRCREAGVAVKTIQALAFEFTTVSSLRILVDADSEIPDEWTDTLQPYMYLDLVITNGKRSSASQSSIGNLTKYSSRLVVFIPECDSSVFNLLQGNQSKIEDLTIHGNNTACGNLATILEMDQLPAFLNVKTVVIKGFAGATLAVDINAHFPASTLLKCYSKICDVSLLTLPPDCTLEWNPDTAPILPVVFRSKDLSPNMKKKMVFLNPLPPKINCSCSMSWMSQLMDCNNNSGDPVFDYLNNISCTEHPGSVMDFLNSTSCCGLYDSPTPTPPNCDGFNSLNASLLAFDHRELPQCRRNGTWRLNPCHVQQFFDDPLPPPSTTTQSTLKFVVKYVIPPSVAAMLVAGAVLVALIFRCRRRRAAPKNNNSKVDLQIELKAPQDPSQRLPQNDYGQRRQPTTYNTSGPRSVIGYMPGQDYMRGQPTPFQAAFSSHDEETEYDRVAYPNVPQLPSNLPPRRRTPYTTGENSSGYENDYESDIE